MAFPWVSGALYKIRNHHHHQHHHIIRSLPSPAAKRQCYLEDAVKEVSGQDGSLGHVADNRYEQPHREQLSVAQHRLLQLCVVGRHVHQRDGQPSKQISEKKTEVSIITVRGVRRLLLLLLKSSSDEHSEGHPVCAPTPVHVQVYKYRYTA